MGMFYPGGEGYGVVELHALIRDPLECDSSEERVMLHRRSVPSPHNPPCFTGEGGVTGQDPPHFFAQCLHLPPPVLLQFRPNHQL